MYTDNKCPKRKSRQHKDKATLQLHINKNNKDVRTIVQIIKKCVNRK